MVVGYGLSFDRSNIKTLFLGLVSDFKSRKKVPRSLMLCFNKKKIVLTAQEQEVSVK